jgi:uncharacterized integral membrane protein
MSQSVLNKVWSFLAIGLLYLCLNVWSITQQWQLAVPGNLFRDGKTTPFGVALYGVLLCGTLFIVLCIIVRLYASRSQGQIWADRFPVIGDLELDTSKPEAKALQAVGIILFVVVPAIGILHFQNKMMNGSVFLQQEHCQSGKPCPADVKVISGWHQMLFSRPTLNDAGERLVYDPDRKNGIAPTFIPIWEPWGVLILSLLSASFGIACLKAIFIT